MTLSNYKNRNGLGKEVSIKKNFMYNILYQMVSALVPIILTPYIARVLTANGVGINSYVTANVTYFQLFSFLGIAGYGQREIAIARNDKQQVSRIFWELQVFHFLCGAIVLIVYFAFVGIVPSEDIRVYYILNSIIIVASILDISWLYQGFECFQSIAKKNVIAKGSIVFFSILLVKSEVDLWKYIVINALGLLFSSVFLWREIYQYVLPLSQTKDLHIFRHTRPVLVFFIPTIAASVYSILDKSVINIVTHSNLENGYYENAYKILTILNVAVQNLSTVMAPRMSSIYGSGDDRKMKQYLNSALDGMLFLAMPLAFGMASIVPNFVPFFLGDGWGPVVPLLYVFMPLVVVLGFSVYLDGMYLVPSGRRLESAKIICIGAVLNLVLNFVMVTYRGALGAAIATLITESVIAGLMVVLAWKIIDKKRILKSGSKYGLFGLAVFICSRGIARVFNGRYTLFLQVAVGCIVYLLLLLITKDSILTMILARIKETKK